jgi:hypothetical protein
MVLNLVGRIIVQYFATAIGRGLKLLDAKLTPEPNLTDGEKQKTKNCFLDAI